MNILIVNPFGIGDCLFATALIHTIKEKFPHHKLGFLCNQRSAALFENNPFIDEIFIYERDDFKKLLALSWLGWFKGFSSFIKRIKNAKFDSAIDLSLTTNFGFFLWFAGIKKRVGYNYKGRGIYLTNARTLLGYESKHVLEYYNDLLPLIGVSPKYKELELYVSQADKEFTRKLFKDNHFEPSNPIMVIAPFGGASWGVQAQLKQWPIEKYTALINKIIEKYHSAIIIVGDQREKEAVDNLETKIPFKILNLAGQTSLGQLSAIIEGSSVFIGNDGGPLHMAVALKKKTISFFGPVSSIVYGPYPIDETQHIVLHKTLECSPCYSKFRLNSCQKKKQCLEDISVDETLEAVGKLI